MKTIKKVIEFPKFSNINGVYYLKSKLQKLINGKPKEEIQKIGLDKLSDQQLMDLDIESENPFNSDFIDFKIRSTKRFLEFLHSKSKRTRILDLGCGNGWFSNQMASLLHVSVYGSDTNVTKLEQGARVFGKSNLNFFYHNLFEDCFPEKVFDLITINRSSCYFNNFTGLVNQLKRFLKDGGEIHIIDCPVEGLIDPEYEKLKHPGNKKGNFIPKEDLEKLDYEIIYDPTKKSLLSTFFGKKDSPYPWLMIKM